MKQTNFFHLTDTRDRLKVQIFKEGEHYRACIAGGWWTAMGKTKAQAIRNVIKSCEREIRYFQPGG